VTSTLETAKDLGYVAGTSVRDSLTLDVQGEEDWYKFTTLGPGTTSHKVQIDFVNAEGDLALGLYASDGTAIKEVDGITNLEQTCHMAVPAIAAAGQKYVIVRVVSSGPETSTDNNVKASGGMDWFGAVAADASEGNDYLDAASNLGSFTGSQVWTNRTIDSAVDTDWYQFTTQRPGTSSQGVKIEFIQAEGDLALALYLADGTLIKQVDGVGNTEEIKLTGLAEGTYYLRVLSNHGDVCRAYKLTLIL
jgi:hypothetical protein